MNDNFKRLTTFDRWPDHVTVSTCALSDAGFVYTGRCDEVECEYCHIRIRDWKDDDVPRQRHMQMSPNCAFARALPGGEPNAHDRTTTSEFISDQQHQTTTSKSISDQQHRTTTYEFMSAKHHGETHGTPSTRQKQFRRSLSDTSKNIFQEKLAQDLAQLQIGNTHPGYPDYGSIKKTEQHDVHTHEHATQKSRVDDPCDQMSSSMLATSHGNTLSEDQTKIMREMGYSDRVIRRGVQIVLSVPGNTLTIHKLIDAVTELEDEASDSSEDGAKGGTKLYKADLQQYFNTSDNSKVYHNKHSEQESISESKHLTYYKYTDGSSESSKEVHQIVNMTTDTSHIPPNVTKNTLLRSNKKFEQPSTSQSTYGLSESCKEVPDMVNTTPNERHHSGNTVNETKLIDKNRHHRRTKSLEQELTKLMDEIRGYKRDVTRLTDDNKKCNETVTRLEDENKDLRSLTMCNKTKVMDNNRHPSSSINFEPPSSLKSTHGLAESCEEFTSTKARNCSDTVTRLKDENIDCKKTVTRLTDENKDFKQTVTRLMDDKKECNETVTKLKDENKDLRSLTMCKVCLDNAVDTLLLPCRHLICCEQCGNELKQCPLCRTKIAATVKTFMS